MCDSKLIELCSDGERLLSELEQAYTNLVESCDAEHYKAYIAARQALIVHHKNTVDDAYFLRRESAFRKLMWTSQVQLGWYIQDNAEVWEKDARAEWHIRHARSYEEVENEIFSESY